MNAVYDVPQTLPPGFRYAPDTVAAVRALKRMLDEAHQPVPRWIQDVAAGRDPNDPSDPDDEPREPRGEKGEGKMLRHAREQVGASEAAPSRPGTRWEPVETVRWRRDVDVRTVGLHAVARMAEVGSALPSDDRQLLERALRKLRLNPEALELLVLSIRASSYTAAQHRDLRQLLIETADLDPAEAELVGVALAAAGKADPEDERIVDITELEPARHAHEARGSDQR